MENLYWHNAFVEALRLELSAYREDLEFQENFPLTLEPLRIDCVIIKKAKDLVITKNIGEIFKSVNIIEYKSPGDYVSVQDFYKVYGYACLYANLERVFLEDMTLSFIESRAPRSLLKHLSENRKYTVAEKSPGIYTVSGDIMAIQLIDSRKLSMEDNLWLRCLSNTLDTRAMERVSRASEEQGKDARLSAYMDILVRANHQIVEELKDMKRAPSLEEIFAGTGLIERAEAKAKAEAEEWFKEWVKTEGKAWAKAQFLTQEAERKALEIAQKMISMGYPLEDIIAATELDKKQVKALYPQKKGSKK
ncbi:MAG: hypothetical protein FWH12_01065 [Treponema sp.]|nr:hypothetical protein [Treponema sp.]